uniref:Uncharacterized protein n=1 Tax=Kalanchoe fedtschenkoi TaxID=63787 RepID=A0A7N0V4Y0_KALFE
MLGIQKPQPITPDSKSKPKMQQFCTTPTKLETRNTYSIKRKQHSIKIRFFPSPRKTVNSPLLS